MARNWPALIGLLLLAVPTFIRLAQQVWTTESGVHGPIVIATGVWLVLQRKAEIAALRKPGSTGIAALIIVPMLLTYIFGRAFDFLVVEVASLFMILVGVAYAVFGSAVLKALWFPILYFAFVIPLPGWLIDTITAPLKTLVSWASTGMLAKAGFPIVREGVTIFVAQYQLLVEDACAGLNSLISLTSISLFYIYILHNANWRYSLFMTLWIIPVAIFANVVRIIVLVLITYYMGDAAAQGFLHSTAGMLMFITALLGIFAVDSAMTPVRHYFAKGRQ